MKKQYRKPSAKLVDFSYDEQVVAVSVPGCMPHYVYSQDNRETCELKDGMMAGARMVLIGCELYITKEP